MTEEIFNDLVEFIHSQCRDLDIPVTMETSIENDLGITGDDGEDFIVAFSKRYNVDIANFHFARYFNPEPSMMPMPNEIKILTVAHLLRAIVAKRFD